MNTGFFFNGDYGNERSRKPQHTDALSRSSRYKKLTRKSLFDRYGFEQADVMVLFGGSILAGGDVLASAMRENVARTYIIVGGEGHTTQTLREQVKGECPDISVDGSSEAEIFDAYLQERYGLRADHLECRSTNCGNNITNLLHVLKEKRIPCASMILVQDATMQLRMSAVLKKYRPDITAINFAAYQAETEEAADGRLIFKQAIHGMWEMDRYISLLMGEIPRLTDDANGYGPRGKDFLAHVDIPEQVQTAFLELRDGFGAQVREADPKYTS